MGLLSRRPSTVERTPSQDYLRSAPPGERKDVLAAVCANRIRELSLCAPDAMGTPIADIYALKPATDVVRATLQQDRSMHAWVARTSMVLLDSALENAPNGWLNTLGLGLESVGIVEGMQLRPELQSTLDAQVQERALGLANYAMNIFWVVAQPQQGDLDRDRTIYRHLFESADDRTVETGFDITAWAAVIIGRLRNSRLINDSPLFSGQYSQMPPMTEAGWYPNPYNFGDFDGNDCSFQRYWDGVDWTDEIRIHDGRRWNERRHDLRTMPNN